MSYTVNTAFVQQFSNNLETLTQQQGSKLMSLVKIDKITGKYKHYERLGAATVQEVLTRHGNTPEPTNMDHSRRTSILRTFDGVEWLDKADEVRMLIDPTNEYSMSLAWAMGRNFDDLLLARMYGTAIATDSADAQSSVAFDTNNVVDEDIGTANSLLNLAKLRAARLKLAKGNVNLDQENAIMICSPDDMDNLLSETAVTSADYNTVKTLVNGRIDSFMGFKFVETNLLNNAEHLTTEGFARCVAFVPSAMGVSMGRDINVRIDERSDKRYTKQLYVTMDFGAVRRQESKVVVVESYRA